MAWKREKFTIATEDGTGKSVSGFTSRGIGLHRSSDTCDVLGHYRWTVTHLNSGPAMLYLNVKGSPAATYIGDLIVDEADWTKSMIETLDQSLHTQASAASLLKGKRQHNDASVALALELRAI